MPDRKKVKVSASEQDFDKALAQLIRTNGSVNAYMKLSDEGTRLLQQINAEYGVEEDPLPDTLVNRVSNVSPVKMVALAVALILIFTFLNYRSLNDEQSATGATSGLYDGSLHRGLCLPDGCSGQG